MPHAATLTAGDLDTYYKQTDFEAMPGGIAATETPRRCPDLRDARFGMAHIYGRPAAT